MKQKIALVDDDRNILTSVTMILEAHGFTVHAHSDSLQAFHFLEKDQVDLIILDIKMPRLDGFGFLKKLREKSTTPVIFLTSKDDESDEAHGLRIGADDYIKKPFSQTLLVERVKTLLRRSELSKPQSVSNASQSLVRGALHLDLERHLCFWKDKPVTLTVTEFLILHCLAHRAGHVKNRDQLIDAAYGENIYVDDRMIDSHIKRLRKKFRDIDEEFSGIQTLYGAGYRFQQD